MRNVRVFVGEPLRAGAVMRLPEQAAEHVVRVLRLRPGAALTLFDGTGGEYEAELLGIARGAVQARVGTHMDIERESPLDVTLLQALARGEKMDWIVQKATELGVTRLVPVATERSVVQLEAGRADRRVTHWQSVATAACEQCGRNRLPRIGAPLRLDQACGPAALPETPLRWILAPGASQPLARAAAAARVGGVPVALLVGPEGGFTDAELGLAVARGFMPVSLGPRVLRTETAGIAALAAMQALAGDCAG